MGCCARMRIRGIRCTHIVVFSSEFSVESMTPYVLHETFASEQIRPCNCLGLEPEFEGGRDPLKRPNNDRTSGVVGSDHFPITAEWQEERT
jgi:hypothetical protein